MTPQIDQIARAVLYEGYLLYPYRPSAMKNQQRWNFGVLYPPAWSATQTGSDRSYFQTECVTVCSEGAELTVSVRFLQIVKREETAGTWQEAIERRVTLDPVLVVALTENRLVHSFSVSGEDSTAAEDAVRKFPVHGQVEVSSARIRPGVFRLTVRVRNVGAFPAETRDVALVHSLASAHAVLQLNNGAFVSQLDAPETLRDDAAACQNIGVWPVLVGEAGTRDTILASPIILYEYPELAPESKGDLFDGTEIDEILTLRILTLSDAEKEEVAGRTTGPGAFSRDWRPVLRSIY